MINKKVVIVDYGMGNLFSVEKKVQILGHLPVVSNNESEILSADCLILPGVGTYSQAVKNIQELNLFTILNRAVIELKIPIMGICLGMQLMGYESEEGKGKGFGWIQGKVRKFSMNNTVLFKVPHTGWNTVSFTKESFINRGVDLELEQYFVHSYYFECYDKEDVLASTTYEQEFTSAISKENIVGVQFHPEKSHKAGMKLIENFINYNV